MLSLSHTEIFVVRGPRSVTIANATADMIQHAVRCSKKTVWKIGRIEQTFKQHSLDGVQVHRHVSQEGCFSNYELAPLETFRVLATKLDTERTNSMAATSKNTP